MIVLNFAHPLPEAQLRRIEELAGEPVERVLEVPVQFDQAQPFEPQAQALVDSIPLDLETWQTASILVNPPSLNFIAVLVLAELHGRMGYFPAHLRTRPVEGALPPRYEVAEILNLQAVRDRARARRAGGGRA